MSNQILTQEEIDALLSAMERGDVDLDQEARKDVAATPYNLTSQNIMLRDQFFALEEVYDKFAGMLRDTLSSSLQRSMFVEFVSSELIKYQEFITAFSGLFSAAAILHGFYGYLNSIVVLPELAIILILVATLGVIAIWGIQESMLFVFILTLIEMLGLGMVIYAGFQYIKIEQINFIWLEPSLEF